MAGELGGREGRPKHIARLDRSGRRLVDPGLSIQPYHEEGRDGSADLWHPTFHVDPPASVRGDDGGSSAGDRRENSERPDPSDGGGLRHGSFGDWRDSLPSEAEGLSSAQKADSSKLPDVPDGYWGSPFQAASETSGDGVRDGDGVLDSSAELDELTGLALTKYREIIALPLIPGDTSFLAIMKQQITVADSILRTATRVDETRLRKRQIDVLPRLLAVLAAEEAKLVEGQIVEAA